MSNRPRLQVTVAFEVPDSDEFSGMLLDLDRWLTNRGAVDLYRDIVRYD